jgi:hypothetical protein
MKSLRVQLFGQLSVEVQDRVLTNLGGARGEELFCFLQIQGNAVFLPEALDAQFWGDVTTNHSRKNLRQALWKLQSALEIITDLGGRVTCIKACQQRASVSANYFGIRLAITFRCRQAIVIRAGANLSSRLCLRNHSGATIATRSNRFIVRTVTARASNPPVVPREP